MLKPEAAYGFRRERVYKRLQTSATFHFHVRDAILRPLSKTPLN